MQLSGSGGCGLSSRMQRVPQRFETWQPFALAALPYGRQPAEGRAAAAPLCCLQVADFGLAAVCAEELQGRAGTLHFMAPEAPRSP